jgi:DNA-binding beta-propeller fold protein YncE
MRTLIFSTFLSAIASAQVGGPFLGYVPDGTRIRPMIGLPSAGSIGAPIESRGFSHIATPPQQYFAVVSAADTGEVLVASEVATGGFSLSPIKGASVNPSMLVLSPRGKSAALWIPSSSHLEIVSGLPDTPSVRSVDASFLNESPLAIAVSDDGQWASALFSGKVYAFGPNTEVVPLQTDPGVQAIAFFHNRHDLAIATTTRAISLAAIDGGATPAVLSDYSDQPLSPRGIAVSFDNQRVVVADAAGTILNVLASASSRIDCGCSPTGVYGLGGAVFRLNGTSASIRSGPRPELKLFDAAAGTVLIVPPAISEIGGRQ